MIGTSLGTTVLRVKLIKFRANQTLMWIRYHHQGLVSKPKSTTVFHNTFLLIFAINHRLRGKVPMCSSRNPKQMVIFIEHERPPSLLLTSLLSRNQKHDYFWPTVPARTVLQPNSSPRSRSPLLVVRVLRHSLDQRDEEAARVLLMREQAHPAMCTKYWLPLPQY